VQLKLELPAALRPPLVIICHKRMTDLPKVRIVVDLLRQEFAVLRKSQVAEECRTVTPTTPRQARVKKEVLPKRAGREVQTG